MNKCIMDGNFFENILTYVQLFDAFREMMEKRCEFYLNFELSLPYEQKTHKNVNVVHYCDTIQITSSKKQSLQSV